MSAGGMPRGVQVGARSRVDIRDVSNDFRRRLGLRDPNVDVQRLLEHKLPQLGVHFDIGEIDELGDYEALTFPDQDEILLRADVYEGLCRGDFRARFTVVHEIGHWRLHPGIAHARREGQGRHRFCEDSEWQADCFAAEFLMPAELVKKHCTTATAVRDVFGVSLEAAIIRMQTLKAEGVLRRS